LKAFFAEKNTIKADAIASQTLHPLKQPIRASCGGGGVGLGTWKHVLPVSSHYADDDIIFCCATRHRIELGLCKHLRRGHPHRNEVERR